MADIQIEPIFALAAEAAQMAQNSGQQSRAKAHGWSLEQCKQILRCPPIQDPPEALVLDDRLGPLAKMTKIGQAHPVDPRGQPAFPATPDQPRHVEQKRGVVGHSSELSEGQNAIRLSCGLLPITRSQMGVNPLSGSSRHIHSG